MRIQICLAVFLLTWSCATTRAQEPQAAAKIDSGKEADIRHLLEIMGAGKMGVQVSQQMSQAIKPLLEHALPPGQERSKKIIDTFLKKLESRITPEAFINLTVPIYDKHFTAEEIRGLIQFYESPLGKKMTGELPAIVDESSVAGRAWASQIVQGVFAEMTGEYPELKQLEEAAPSKP